MRRPRALLGVLLFLAGPFASDGFSQSTHGVLWCVPAPGSVAVDGRIGRGEWDLRGRMLVYSAASLRSRYSIEVFSMWDRDAFYIALRYRDPTPLVNEVDAEAAPYDGWQADAFQARFTTDRSQIHLDAWYSSRSDASVLALSYDRVMNTEASRIFRGPSMRLEDPCGVRMAFGKADDGAGYTQEIRLPWSLLYRRVPAVVPGLEFRFTGEYYWGGPSARKWPKVMWSDPIDPENPVRVVVYQSPRVWGRCRLLASGAEARGDALEGSERDRRLEGPIPIRFEVPTSARRFSVAIDDASGRRVRSLAAHAEVGDYLVGSGPGRRAVEVPWDGRSDGGWDPGRRRFVGEVVAPGEYVARILVHEGIGVVHAGSFANPGTPPWPTADGTGAWLSDHASPCGVACVPGGARTRGRVVLIARHSEAGVPCIGIDGRGRKIWEWVRQTAELHHVAADASHFWFAYRYAGRPFLGRLDPDRGRQVPLPSGAKEAALEEEPRGLAVTRHGVALAFPGGVELRDSTGLRVVRRVAVAEPRQIAWTPGGGLVGLSGDRAFRVAPEGDTAEEWRLPGVARPSALAVDSRGRTWIADADREVVVCLDAPRADARALLTVGRPGGRRPGPFDPRRMAAPVALSVEERGDEILLWCVEGCHRPRRVVVWRVDVGERSASVARDYTGGTGYNGTGGLLSDDDPGLGIHAGVVYSIEDEGLDHRVVSVMGGRPDPRPGLVALFAVGSGTGAFSNGYHFRSAVSGREREYYVEGERLQLVFQPSAGRWRCVAALGNAASGVRFPEGFPQPEEGRVIFSWADLDGDGYQQPEEVSWHDLGDRGLLSRANGWGYRCGRDLGWAHGGWAIRPAGFTEGGAPIYDLSRAERLPGELGRRGHEGGIHPTRFGWVLQARRPGYTDPHGTIHGLIQLEGYDRAGTLRWTYPAYWHSVHGAFTAPMAMPGVIMGALKVTGVVPVGERDVIALRGNMGQEFLIRDDGLYVGELFTDQRLAPASLPPREDILGRPIDATSMGGEPFSGWIGRQRDGRVRLTYGQTDVRIAEVRGLDSLRELPPRRVRVDDAAVARARSFVPRASAARSRGELTIRRGADGDLETAAADAILRRGGEEVARVSLRDSGTGLHIRWSVDDATPLVNRGEDPRTAFKTGDGVSLFVAPDREWAPNEPGGTRIVITELDARPLAVVCRPGGEESAPFTFTSPVRSVRFAHVSVEPRIRVSVRRGELGYTIATTIPWKVLGGRPAPGSRLRGDLGVLFGARASRAVARIVRWVDRQTNVVNDLPTEAEFFPARWGSFRVEAP